MSQSAIAGAGARHRLRTALVVINVLAVSCAAAAIPLYPKGDRVVVFAAPWSDPARMVQIITDADGALVDGGAADWIAIAEGREKGFAGRLLAAGALLVLDGKLAQACLERLGYNGSD